jgi:hypothetical protein
MTPPNLSEVVSNVSEVVDALSESPYAKYLSSQECLTEDL